MTTASAALQTSVAAAPSLEIPELSKAAVRSILVSIPDRKMALFANGKVVRIYRVAVGKSSTPSPVGEFKIVTRVSNPTYYHKGHVVAAGKGNPVGTRWMGLSAKGYGIHGTNQPRSIGKAESTGCIRMGKRDIEELFTLVDVGDAVQIRGERDEQIAAVFGTGTVPELVSRGDAATETIARVETRSGSGGGR
ncbi:MAG: L,D-transpeptidase [Terriglobales bacterium]|jgi:lipoprotein-anchoring transpeptidase ErfK/SrfK